MADYVQVLGARLRDVRQREGLSLQRVEQRSGGRWKAVVVGSYGRGDRAVTVQKLAEQRSGGRWKAVVVGSYGRGDRAVTVQKLAELVRFYGVPMSLLVPPDDLGSEDGVAIPIVAQPRSSLHAAPSKSRTVGPVRRGYRAPPTGARNIAEDPIHRH